MTGIFLKLVNMSISASWLVLAVLMLRGIFRKAPKWTNVLLWGIVAFRLICPFSIESALSLIPSAQTIPQEVLSQPSFDAVTELVPADERVNDYPGDRYFEGATVPADNGVDTMSILAVIWLIGVLAMLCYTAVSYWRLRRSVDTAVLLRENIFQSENVVSPFVLGLFRPRIYVPFALDGDALAYILAHERSHIQRRDHWWKPLGFLLLAVYWFNPLMWLSYVLLCRDIELACDEKVIGKLEGEQRICYSKTLVSCSVSRRAIAACPLAFGEVGVKERVRSVLSYKKPAFWIVALSLIACAIVAVCFLTDPEEETAQPFGNEYTVGEVIYVKNNLRDSVQAQFALSSDQALYRMEPYADQWSFAGVFSEMKLKKTCFDDYFIGAEESATWQEGFTAQDIRKANDAAWSYMTEDGTGYYLLCQENGDIYLVALFYDVEGELDPESNDSEIFYILRLETTPKVSCVAYSGNVEAQLGLTFCPDGFGYDPSELAIAEINTDGRVVFTPEWETDVLVVTEDYCQWNGEHFSGSEAEIKTYTLTARADGSFELPVERHGDMAAKAYYRVERDNGFYVFVLNFPGVQIDIGQTEMDQTYVQALDDAICDIVTKKYTEVRTMPHHLFFVTSNQLLAYTIHTSPDDSVPTGVTLYLLVVRQVRPVDSSISIRTEDLVPMVITFAIDENGEYILEEYWEAPEGNNRKSAVRERFPAEAAEIALKANLYEQVDLRSTCHKKAMLFTTPGVMFRDIWVDEAKAALRIDLCLRVIASSPAHSSNPYDYIAAHPAEFNELVGYSGAMLRYSFGKFLQGGQDGLYGHIMAEACRQIASQWGEMQLSEESTFFTGQEWFDSVKEQALELMRQYSGDELELQYPASWVLIQTMLQSAERTPALQ